MLRPSDTATRERRSLAGLWRFRLDRDGEGRAARWFAERLPGAGEMAVPASFNYAGIHRPVWLYSTGRPYLTDLTVVTELDGPSGRIEYRTEASGAEGTEVRVVLRDADGDEVARGAGRSDTLTVPDVHRWAPGDGYLYDLEVQLFGMATGRGVPVPGLSSALAYYDTARRERLPASLIQGMRDFFGAHTYLRTDHDGVYHTLWSGDRSEQRVR